MSNSTQVVDLFRWAARNGKVARAKQPRRVGLAAALAVVVEHGRRETRDVSARQLGVPRAVESAPLIPVRRVAAPEPRPAPTVAATAAMDERVRCPRCGREGFVHADFGLRRVQGRLRAQSWCRACRAEKGGAVHSLEKKADPVRLDDLPLWSVAH